MKDFKHIIYIIVCLAACLLTACYEGDDSWFYHTLNYEGNNQEQQIALTANLEVDRRPQIFVNTAYFVGDKERADTIYWDANNPSHYRTELNRGYLHDADVRIRVNGGEWMALAEKQDSFPVPIYQGTGKSYEVYYYTCDYVLQPLDSVEIRVKDAATKREAGASARMPERVDTQINLADLAAYDGAVEDNPDMTFMTLRLPGFRQNGDMLCLNARVYETLESGSGKNHRTEHKTLYGIYAHDQRFADFSNMFRALEQGWYGGTSLGIACDAPTDSTSMLIATNDKIEYITIVNGDTIKSNSAVDSIIVDVSLISRSTWLFYGSLVQNGLIDNSPYLDPFESDADNEVEQAVDDINGLFLTLGDLEAIPVYSNIEGGYGRVLSSSHCRLRLLP